MMQLTEEMAQLIQDSILALQASIYKKSKDLICPKIAK